MSDPPNPQEGRIKYLSDPRTTICGGIMALASLALCSVRIWAAITAALLGLSIIYLPPLVRICRNCRPPVLRLVPKETSRV